MITSRVCGCEYLFETPGCGSGCQRGGSSRNKQEIYSYFDIAINERCTVLLQGVLHVLYS